MIQSLLNSGVLCVLLGLLLSVQANGMSFCANEKFIMTQYKIFLPPQLPQPSPSPQLPPPIRVSSGENATLTYFDDSQLQCGSYAPGDLVVAVNPKLLGFTDEEWLRFYANASPSEIPWCNKQLTITINFVEYTFTIGDTCDPVGPTPSTPNAGGKCDYDDVIDIWNGSDLLFGLFGDDFYQGPLQWVIQ
jgi:hypothetical protein